MLTISLLLTGCFPKPEIRWGQAKVPSVPDEHPAKVEAQRQAGEYLATAITEDPPKGVAVALSTSLGVADKAVDVPEVIVENLRAGESKDRTVTKKFEERVEKFAGKKIEDTGLNILPGLGGMGIVLLIAAVILVPGFGSLVLFVFKRLRGTTSQIIKSIGQYEASDPQNAAKLKAFLSSNMNKAQKTIVTKLK